MTGHSHELYSNTTRCRLRWINSRQCRSSLDSPFNQHTLCQSSSICTTVADKCKQQAINIAEQVEHHYNQHALALPENGVGSNMTMILRHSASGILPVISGVSILGHFYFSSILTISQINCQCQKFCFLLMMPNAWVPPLFSDYFWRYLLNYITCPILAWLWWFSDAVCICHTFSTEGYETGRYDIRKFMSSNWFLLISRFPRDIWDFSDFKRFPRDL